MGNAGRIRMTCGDDDETEASTKRPKKREGTTK